MKHTEDIYTRNFTVEGKINGKMVRYDACSQSSLDEAKKFYSPNFEYIGSGDGFYVDGTLNSEGVTHHFFKKIQP